MSGRSHESYWPAFSHFYNPMACKSMGDPEACHDGIISFLWNWLVGLIKCRFLLHRGGCHSRQDKEARMLDVGSTYKRLT
ncbi:hypothetical protein SCA6_010863 [Theobroma cacao]